MNKIKIIIQQIVRVFSTVLWRTIRTYRVSRGVHQRLIKRSSTTVCGVFLIPRFLFRIKQRVKVLYTKVLACRKQRVEVFTPNLIIELSWVPSCIESHSFGGIRIIWYQSQASKIRLHIQLSLFLVLILSFPVLFIVLFTGLLFIILFTGGTVHRTVHGGTVYRTVHAHN